MTIEERVIAIVSRNVEKNLQVNLESELTADLHVDSLNKIMIIAALEDELDIEINEADFSNIHYVRDIVTQLKKAYPEL